MPDRTNPVLDPRRVAELADRLKNNALPRRETYGGDLYNKIFGIVHRQAEHSDATK